MSMKQLRWAAALSAILAGQSFAPRSTAETPYYYPVAAPSNAPILGRPIATSTPAATLARPVAAAESLGAPVPPSPFEAARVAVAPVSYEQPGVIVRGQVADSPYQTTRYEPPPAPPPPGTPVPAGPYGAPPADYNSDATYNRPLAQPNGFWDRCRGWFSGTNGQGFNCHSDCSYDSLISPVSNPFFFEDPRSITEIKPLFLFQNSPSHSPIFGGGDSFFYGLQGRLALNDRWSIVINKLGVVTFNPKNPTPEFSSDTGFAEFNIGPKFTFLHNTSTNTVAAVGLNFDLPIGDKHVFQDTGSLSLDPYFTIGQTFGSSSYGQFNFIGTVGYNFSVDNERAEFFHSALHLDYDIARAHKYYPLLELNYFHYTDGGKAHDFGIEGIDLGNFGSTTVAEHDILNLALGFRYKFSEHIQLGIAAEFPLIKAKDIQDFRMTFDMIFRF